MPLDAEQQAGRQFDITRPLTQSILGEWHAIGTPLRKAGQGGPHRETDVGRRGRI